MDTRNERSPDRRRQPFLGRFVSRDAMMNIYFILALVTGPILLTTLWFLACGPAPEMRRQDCIERGGTYIPQSGNCAFPIDQSLN